jgi:hypothetical protein
MWHGKPCFMIAAVLLALPGAAAAQDLGARAMGRGYVGRADGADAAAEALNLAAVSLTERYEIFAGSELGADSRFLLRSGAVDSRTSAVTLGAGYRRLVDNVAPTGTSLPGWKAAGETLEDPTTHQGVHLGIAVPFLERRLSIAAHGRYDWRDSAQTGADTAFNFGFSVAGKPLSTLTLAAGVRDLLTNGYPDTRRTADFGVRFDPGPYLGVEADVVSPLQGKLTFDKVEWHAGLDVAALKWLALRGGWYVDDGAHFVTAGIGLVSDKASLDYGMRIRVDDPSRNFHGLDLRVVF